MAAETVSDERFEELLSIACVRDRAAGIRWYEAFFGRPADEVIGEEALWRVGSDAYLVVDERPERAGACTITFAARRLDAMLERMVAAGIRPEHAERYANGVHHVTIIDPDGNSLSLAEAPPGSAP